MRAGLPFIGASFNSGRGSLASFGEMALLSPLMRAKGGSVQASGPFAVPNSTRIEVDPALKPASMTAAFKQFGRIHIPGFLKPASAEELHRALAAETLWVCST